MKTEPDLPLDTYGWAASPAGELLTRQFLSSALARPDAEEAITTGFPMRLSEAVTFATES